jgi:hypothetical protein
MGGFIALDGVDGLRDTPLFPAWNADAASSFVGLDGGSMRDWSIES